MYQEIYIVTRQKFSVSRGFHYEIADNNPVVIVFETETAAIEWAERLRSTNDASGNKTEVINHHSSMGLMYTYVFKGDNNMAERAYNIIHETLLS